MSPGSAVVTVTETHVPAVRAADHRFAVAWTAGAISGAAATATVTLPVQAGRFSWRYPTQPTTRARTTTRLAATRSTARAQPMWRWRPVTGSMVDASSVIPPETFGRTRQVAGTSIPVVTRTWRAVHLSRSRVAKAGSGTRCGLAFEVDLAGAGWLSGGRRTRGADAAGGRRHGDPRPRGSARRHRGMSLLPATSL